jgi:hypothetical protein
MSLTQRVCFIAKNRFENSHQGLGELVLEVVLGIDRNIILEYIKWIFRLLIGSGTW